MSEKMYNGCVHFMHGGDKMEPRDKDQFESLMRIAEFNIRQFNERRDYSWKIALSFWGTIIGSIAIIRPFQESISNSKWAVILGGVIVILVHVRWLYGVFIADQKDKEFAFKARDKAMKIMGIEPPKPEKKNFLADWSAQFQFMVTFMLVVISIAIILLPKNVANP
jgi:hypothetical protein